MELCLITNDPLLAREAQDAGVERIMLDLETRGKQECQAGRGLFLSDHKSSDISKLRAVLNSSQLMVRIDALFSGTAKELDAIIEAGADVVMLPMWKTVEEVMAFVDLVARRARTNALIETTDAVESIDALVALPNLDEVHVGLNDLSMNLGTATIFDVLVDGLIDRLARKVNERGIAFGFGGIARLDAEELPVSPHRVIGEHVRLGAKIGLLGRTFRKRFVGAHSPQELSAAVRQIRESIEYWRHCGAEQLEQNRLAMAAEVKDWAVKLSGS